MVGSVRFLSLNGSLNYVAPKGESTILLTIPFANLDSGYAIQIDVSIDKQYNGKLAVRVKDSGNWQDWNVIS